MGVRLASLKAAASLDATGYSSGARQIDADNKRMTQGQAQLNRAQSETQVRVGETARAFDRYRASIDPAFRAQRNLETGMRRLDGALARGAITAAEHGRLMGQLQTRFSAAATVTTGFGGALGQLRERIAVATSSVSLLVAGLGALGALSIGRAVFDAALAFERIDGALLAATGSTAGAAQEFKFLRSETERLGLDLRNVSGEYAKLAVAARGTALEGAATREIFTAVAEASTALRLSADQTGGALVAIQQIISKGTVSAEELRGQLGERLVGAFNIAARAVGGTTVELGKMLQQGQLTADKFLPKFAAEVRRTFAVAVPDAADSAQAAVNRFNNALFEAEVELARGGFLDAVVDALKEIRAVLTDPAFLAGLRGIGAGIRDAFGWILRNKDELLIVAGAYAGYRVAGPIGAAVGGSSTAIVTQLDKPRFLRSQVRALDERIAGAERSGEFQFVGVSKSDALSKLRAEREALAKQIPDSIGYLGLAKGAVSLTKDALVDAGRAALDFWNALGNKGGGAGGGGSGGGRGSGGRDSRGALRELDRLGEYITGLEDELRLVKLTGVERTKEEAILRATKLIQDDRIAGEEKLSDEAAARIKQLVEQRAIEEDAQAKADEARRKAAEAQEEMERRQKEFNDEVLGETASLIEGLWSGGKDGFDETLQYWKRRLIAWLAEMAAKLILSPIIAPIVQSAGLFGGALGSTGGLGANFGSGGVGGIGNIGSLLGGLGSSIDKLGVELGLQSSRAPFYLSPNGSGLFGTNTALSDVAGGALGGLGIGATVATLTGGNALGGSVGGLVGGALGSFLGPLGSLLGSAVGGFLGSLFKGGKPTNATAIIDFDQNYSRTQVPFSKETAETRAAINNAADQIVGVVDALESVGTVFSDRVTRIGIGVRDPSYIQFESGQLLRSATGDPNALALTAIEELIKTAKFESESLAIVAKRDYGSLQELTSALDFARNTYDAIAEARPALTQTEQAMKTLTDGLKAARKEAEKLGLSVDKLDLGARVLFDRDIADQIQAIVDPVGLALAEFERGAAARVNVARQLGADLVQVERLNALERARIVDQVGQQSVAGLRSLIDEIEFGGLAGGVAPEQQFFSALTRYNQARAGALDFRTPEALADYEAQTRAFLPLAQNFLGVSTRYADLRGEALSTLRTLSAPSTDRATAAIIAATTQGSAAVVEAVKENKNETAKLNDQFAQLRVLLQTIVARAAA